jgi:hypothetical protein
MTHMGDTIVSPALSPQLAIWSRPPGWPLHLAIVLAAIGLLDACSAPGFFIFEFAGSLLVWLVLGVIWLARFLFFLIKRPSRLWTTSWRRWAVGPVLAAIVFALLLFEVPMSVRFALSRNALTRLSQNALAAGPTGNAARWKAPVQTAGLFNVAVAEVTPQGQVFLRVAGTEFMRSFGGYAYSPHGTPSDPEGSFEPLGDSWYVWHTSW